MKSKILAVLFLIVLPVHAAENTVCSGISFSEVSSLSELPKEVISILSSNGRHGIADNSNEKFNDTDIALYENAPFRRFNLAAISLNRILVAVEHGGRGYAVELWSIERSNSDWHGKIQDIIFKVPGSLDELIRHSCR